MKKLLLSIIFILSAIPSIFAQKVINDLNAEKRIVGGFHGIEVATGISLVITEGTSEEVAVSAASIEFRDKIITTVDNGVLKIYYENKLSSMNTKKVKKDLKAYVSYKKIDYVEASTGANVNIVGTLKSTSIKIKAFTGSEIEGRIESADLEVNQSTGSKITLFGEAVKLDIEGETGSKFEGVELKTKICNVQVSTGAKITVTAEKELYVKANTGGYVKYKGEAPIREIKRNTGGTVSKI